MNLLGYAVVTYFILLAFLIVMSVREWRQGRKDARKN